MRRFYFGCIDRVGHFYFDANRRSYWQAERIVPWGLGIDSEEMMPTVPDRYGGRPTLYGVPHGATRLHHKDGWTALIVADNSIDSRPGSKSAFIFEAELDEPEAWAAAREYFPTIANRFPSREGANA